MALATAYLKTDLPRYNTFMLGKIREQFDARSLSDASGNRLVVKAGKDPCDLADALVNDNHVCIQDEPGSGKTLVILNKAREILEGKLRAQYGLSTVLYMELHHLNDTTIQIDPYDYLRTQLSNAAKQLDLSTDFAQHVYSDPGTVIALDGLDEIADPKLRQGMRDAISHAKSESRNAYDVLPKILEVATRPYVSVDEYVKYSLAPLSENQMAEIFMHELNQQFDNIYGKDGIKKDHREAAIGLRQRDLLQNLPGCTWSSKLRNPSYLRYAVYHQNPLPENFGDFLESATNGFLLGIQVRKDLRDELSVKVDVHNQRLGQYISDMIPILREMAWLAHSKNRRGLSMDDILSIERWDPEGSFSNSLLSKLPRERKVQILDAIAQKAPFLSSYTNIGSAAKMYYFTHLGLQEFLAGQALAEKVNDRELSTDGLIDLVQNTWWRQPVLYSLSSLGFNDANIAVRKVLKLGDTNLLADAYPLVKDKLNNNIRIAVELATKGVGETKGIDANAILAAFKLETKKKSKGPLSWIFS